MKVNKDKIKKCISNHSLNFVYPAGVAVAIIEMEVNVLRSKGFTDKQIIDKLNKKFKKREA